MYSLIFLIKTQHSTLQLLVAIHLMDIPLQLLATPLTVKFISHLAALLHGGILPCNSNIAGKFKSVVVKTFIMVSTCSSKNTITVQVFIPYTNT